jgi:hypothetical protein
MELNYYALVVSLWVLRRILEPTSQNAKKGV